MTLKRYQPARKRKRSSKKNRPLKIAVAIGVVGVAAGLAYASLHGEMLMGLLDGSLDLPDHRFGRPKDQPLAAKAPMAPQHKLVAASPASVKLATASAQPLRALAAPSPSVAPMQQAADPKPSAFPENGQAKDDDPIAEASPLRPAGVASLQPEHVAAKPAVKTATPAPVQKASPAIVAKGVAHASPTARPTTKPSPAPVAKATPKTPAVAQKPKPAVVAAKPTAKPVAAKPKPVVAAAPGQRMGSLYFDKNSSYLSSAEKDRLARLVNGLKHGGTIHVSGYADALGDAGYNRWMAQRRASRVAELIRAQMGGKVNVVVDTVGSVGNTASADGDRQSRRVEVEVR